MSAVRIWTVMEIDRRRHVATAISPPPGHDWMVVISRVDGTEPVVVCEAAGQVHCTCGRNHPNVEPCAHFRGLQLQAVIVAASAKPIGFFARAAGLLKEAATGESHKPKPPQQFQIAASVPAPAGPPPIPADYVAGYERRN